MLGGGLILTIGKEVTASMSIRPCALRSEAFCTLKEAYDQRDAQALKWRKQGKKVIGKLGFDVPDELLLAAGMFPVQVCADVGKPLAEANKYLENAFESVVRAQFEKLVDGTYGELLDGLAISNSNDTIIRIFYYLREIHRVEPEKNVPPVTFIDWTFTRSRLWQNRCEFVIELFKQQVEQWAGRTVSDDEIRAAGKLMNENRAALRAMAALRHGEEVRINGSEALTIIGAGLFMDKEEHTELVRRVVEDAKAWAPVTGKRVFYSGANHEDTALYEKLEELGLVVVGEDTDWGDRSYERDMDLSCPVIRGIVDRYFLRTPTVEKSRVAQSVEILSGQVEATGAQGVIFYTNAYAEVATFNMPEQRKMLEGRGIKHMTFSRMTYPLRKNEGLDEKLAEFAAEMKGGE